MKKPSPQTGYIAGRTSSAPDTETKRHLRDRILQHEGEENHHHHQGMLALERWSSSGAPADRDNFTRHDQIARAHHELACRLAQNLHDL